MTDTIREALAAQPEPEYCEHAWKYGGRHAGCVAHCGLPRRPPTAAPTQPDNDQSGGGAVAPEQAKVEKAGVAPVPPDPIAAPAYCTHARKMGARGSECVIRCGLPVAPVAAPAQPDDDVVRRFCCFTAEDGVYESPTGEHVAYTDYAAVSDALRRERERAESAEGDALREIVNEERQIAKELARQLVGVKAERDALLLRIPNVSKVEAECRTLEDWKLRAMHMEFGWSSCSRCAAQLQGRAESAEAERDALRAELAEDAGGWARAERAEAERERLRADAERLDWLDVNWHGAIFGKNERGYLPWADGVDYQPTLRAAIDAARGKP